MSSSAPMSLPKLTLAVALGLWLGFIAIALTSWLASRYLFPQSLAPVAQAVQQLGKPAAVAPEPPNRMFEQYQQNLQKQEQQQALDQARNNARNLSNPKCQFWLQQDQNAPNEKTRANVLQFCD
ncbi:hypothetical protein ACJ6YJ_17875 [Pseudomonas marginalis]|uniref:hypothetical protein n=1 Tax=Pseudomonas TaxID=286 RepID=UPI000811E2C3|nr:MULTISPECIES: hypothetical protein [unclassified Pseudomonas]MDT9630507.1 hypothetical protein [Pseudomonas sp. JV449]MDT9631512.1 hypothetical protein [Pseudomonas sp. JV449]TKJ74427.1 hypothetical protein PspCFBP13509_27525 [Pseudomonas sp. CFBP13509]SAM32071.1 hypothetical protein BN1864_LIB5394:02118 [Pseudomonas sp. 1 R 17]